MPITGSGQIALIADIEAEFDQTGSTDISLTTARDDASLSDGQVSMTDFYGLSDAVAPTVSTYSSTSITSSSMNIRGNVSSDGGATITERGFYFGTSTTATNNTKYTVSGTTGNLNRSMTGLNSSTTYYVFAYATNSAGTTIASMVTVATSAPARPYPWQRSSNSAGQDCYYYFSGGGQGRISASSDGNVTFGSCGGSGLSNNGDFYAEASNGRARGVVHTTHIGTGYPSGCKVDGYYYSRTICISLPATGGYAAGGFCTSW